MLSKFKLFLERNKINNQVAGEFFDLHPNYICMIKGGSYPFNNTIKFKLKKFLELEKE